MNHRLFAVFPALVLASLLLLVFSAGLALIIAPSALLVRDLTHALPVLFMVLFWVTPVFYAPQMIPPKFAVFNALNPVGWFIALFRETLFDGRIPSLQAFGAAACASCISLSAGLVFFSYKEQQLLKNL
jgi:ABC-type polysaccharide/polyol phosphate export permease